MTLKKKEKKEEEEDETETTPRLLLKSAVKSYVLELGENRVLK